MATLTKDRARKPLAQSPITSNSWSSDALGGVEHFNLRVMGDTHSFTLALERKEAMRFIEFVASHDTFVYGQSDGGMGWSDRRSFADKLRALADKVEAK